ncbi:sensor histidine kinase [Fusibacter sp. JL216-2]|uniref:sensor histidine kinase n=1 Tax=Fusibacter sp. JL216-2 TaxID=3071453 RepID=UPI003D325FD8
MKLMKMSIKRKLYLTYLTGLVVTILLMMTVGFIAHGNRWLPPIAKETEASPENMMTYAFQFRRLNSVEEASRSINMAVNNLKGMGEESFLVSESFWKEADMSFRPNVSLAVFVDNTLFFKSKKLPDAIDFDAFPKFGQSTSYPNESLFNEHEITIQRQVDYVTQEGHEVTAFILFGVESQASRFFVILLNNILLFMVLSTFIMGIISYFVVRSITVPLDKLKNAADEVRRGNLEYEVKHTTDDKIGELSEAFEAMRLQLLENEKIRDQYEASRRQMISSISHDLRTPVTAIKLHAEGIMDGVAGSPEKMYKYLKSMAGNAQVIDRLLKELTLFSNLDSEQERFQFTEINLCRFVEDLAEEWAFDYKAQNVKFDLKLKCQDQDTLKLDVIHFRRVLVNVVENAIKYVDKRPLVISIGVQTVDDMYRLTISDNGQGVPEDHVDQIFDRFHRVDAARQSSVPGSGLGLSIARQIVLKHGGKIWAQNIENSGLEISIELGKS